MWSLNISTDFWDFDLMNVQVGIIRDLGDFFWYITWKTRCSHSRWKVSPIRERNLILLRWDAIYSSRSSSSLHEGRVDVSTMIHPPSRPSTFNVRNVHSSMPCRILHPRINSFIWNQVTVRIWFLRHPVWRLSSDSSKREISRVLWRNVATVH